MLYLYLSTSDKAVSAALMRLEDGVQRPVYYVSKSLIAAELNYTPLEKLILALLTASRKLKHYFDAHSVTVYTAHPIKAALRRADFSGRMEKWSVELGRFHIEYAPRTAIKGQVLADLVAEFTEPGSIPESTPDSPGGQGPAPCLVSNSVPATSAMQTEPAPTGGQGTIPTAQSNGNPTTPDGATNCANPDPPNLWTLYIDGSSAKSGSGVGMVLRTPEGAIIEQAVRLGFQATNNEAEYEALILGLKSATNLGAQHLQIHCDSRLVASQLTGEFATKNPNMEAYMRLAKKLMQGFSSAHIEQFPRANNAHADALATLASAVPSNLQRTIQVEYLASPSLDMHAEVNTVEVNPGGSWMDPIVQYLRMDQLPADADEAHRVKAQASRYWLSPDQVLYRRSFSGPYLRCVHPRQTETMLAELHAGSCGSHTGGRSLANRARSQGYWWPYMQKDAIAHVRKCDKCQRFSPIIRQPATELHPITSPWPFAQWGLDIMGPFPRGTGSRRYLLVATDYFTKWVEAEALQHIAESNVRGFLWKNIITRFGIPRALISDNGTQFKNKSLEEFCTQHGITQHFSSVGYPQGNGQAEASNKTILDGLKRRLEEAKGAWVEELPSVLWAFRTTPRRSTGETPFSLTYGTEAVIPLEISFPTMKTIQADNGGNEAALEANLDFSQEKRETAMIRLAHYQQVLTRQRKAIMRCRDFQVGSWVLRKVMGSAVNSTDGKLRPTWEGPFKITSASATGAYYLEDADGNPIPNPWNAHHLRYYYF